MLKLRDWNWSQNYRSSLNTPPKIKLQGTNLKQKKNKQNKQVYILVQKFVLWRV